MSADTERLRLLVVEDNETIRGALAILLEESGYRVMQAGLGEEAFRITTEHLPDLILMDLGLPDVGGLEIIRRLRSREATREIPIVALTGRALDSDIEACRAAGCSAYLVKPVDTTRLLEEISGFLRKPGE